MATSKERDILQDVKTDVAVLKTDISYIKHSMDENNSATQAILAMINSDHFLTSKIFNDYIKSLDKRLKPTEEFLEKNKTGIEWSNLVITKALAILAFIVVATAFGLSVAKIVSLSH